MSDDGELDRLRDAVWMDGSSFYDLAYWCCIFCETLDEANHEPDCVWLAEKKRRDRLGWACWNTPAGPHAGPT